MRKVGWSDLDKAHSQAGLLQPLLYALLSVPSRY